MSQQEIHELNFKNAEELLLYHKYLYYELNKPMVSDAHFDGLDRYCRDLSKHVDPKRFPPEGYVHETVVGFDPNHSLWPVVVERFKIKIK